MPSDEQTIFKALWRPVDSFRSALAVTIEQLRSQLADAEAEEQGDDDTTQTELGTFASGQIDFDRFAAVAAREKVALPPAAVERIRTALSTLIALAQRKEELLHAKVEAGGDLVGTVRSSLGEVGRAFAAARTVELTRRDAWKDDVHGKWLEAFPFEQWNAAERGIAPPLLVTVQGSDLEAGGLAGALDGATKIVLQVEGDAPPAPLVRLISPGLYVAQATGKDAEKALERFGAWDGPGVLALLPEGAATWTHDPDAGPALGDRLAVDFVPDELPTKAIGGISAFQQGEPLRQLKALKATRPAAAGDAGSDGAAVDPDADPVDKLAAWLLSEADLTGLE